MSLNFHQDAIDIEWEKFRSSVIIEVKRGNNIFTSSAVAISRNVLLTCAHSVVGVEGGRVFWDPQYRPQSKKFVKIKTVVIHPDYDFKKSKYKNDLAIVILKNGLPSKIRPASILSKDCILSEGMQAHRLGYGERNDLNIRTWTNPEIAKYDSKNKCIVMNDINGKIGDSGGPLFLKQGSRYQLFALHSTIEGDGKSYTVSVRDYMEWIQQNVNLTPLIG